MPAYVKCYDKAANNKCTAWAIIIMYPQKIIDLVHIYVFPQRRREGYGGILLKGIMARCKAIYTDWEASPEESRAMCMKAGMKKENIKGRDLLVWREEKKEGEEKEEPKQSNILTRKTDIVVPKSKIILP
jgi:hypothetical protein